MAWAENASKTILRDVRVFAILGTSPSLIFSEVDFLFRGPSRFFWDGRNIYAALRKFYTSVYIKSQYKILQNCIFFLARVVRGCWRI